MFLSHAGWVSIAEIVLYVPALIAAFVVCSRHGWHRASGWYYTIFMCIVRLAGAIAQLLSYSDHSDGVIKAVFIFDSIGLSPLLFATLGVLSRFADFILAKQGFMFGMREFRLLQLLITLGLILSIVGGTSSSTSDNGTITVSSESKAGVGLYIAAFVGVTLVAVVSTGYRKIVPRQESRILAAVFIAWPFILIRLLYSALAVFSHDHAFSIATGSVAIHVGMTVVEEFIVVLIYLFLGFNLQTLEPEEQGGVANRQWKSRR